MASLTGIRKAAAYYLTGPVVQLLAKTGVTPNTITWFGFLLAIGAAVLITMEYLVAAGLLVLVAGFFDIVDGALARRTDQVTRFGAVLDAMLNGQIFHSLRPAPQGRPGNEMVATARPAASGRVTTP